MTAAENVFGRVLSQRARRPLLVDVGSADGAPPVWRTIAPWCCYLAFDADPRASGDRRAQFQESVVSTHAVVADLAAGDIVLYLTEAAQCSSTLRPDPASLAEYFFSPLFEVKAEKHVPATTLDDELARRAWPCIDWLKIDSQGTDLRIFQSLRDDVRDRVLALDLEPGLIDAYEGEDLFVDSHRTVVRQGFWLSNVRIGQAVRMRHSTLRAIEPRHADVTPVTIETGVRGTPAWVEARYLRTIEWVVARSGPHDLPLLWVFAVLDGQIGFALDVAVAYREHAGPGAMADLLENEAVRILRQPARDRAFKRAARRLRAAWR